MRIIHTGIILTLMTTPAAAQICGQTNQILSKLASPYGEVKIFDGRVGKKSPMVFYLNPATGTWTMLIIMDERTACIHAAGDKFKVAEKDKGKPL